MRQIFLPFLISLTAIFHLSKAVPQDLDISLTSRVDTSDPGIMEAYQLYKDYLKSRPDSAYMNPHWKRSESKTYTDIGYPADRASVFMYRSYDRPSSFFHYFPPKILAIQEVDPERYRIRTLFYGDSLSERYQPYNPRYIHRVYATRNDEGELRLENCLSYETRNWGRHQMGPIEYVVHPDHSFDEEEARQGMERYQKMGERLGLDSFPSFSYYLTPSAEEMAHLFNLNYWLSYSTGISQVQIDKIFSAKGNENFPHEFAHMLCTDFEGGPEGGKPRLIIEGIASWLGGSGKGSKTLEKDLREFSEAIHGNDTLTLNDIITHRYQNPYDNKPLYTTGGFIFKRVHEAKGLKGVKRLWECERDRQALRERLEAVFEKDYEELNSWIIDEIQAYDG